jgi:hypothetical protein
MQDNLATMPNSFDRTGWLYNAEFVAVDGVFYGIYITNILSGKEILVGTYGDCFWQANGYPGGRRQPLIVITIKLLGDPSMSALLPEMGVVADAGSC